MWARIGLLERIYMQFGFKMNEHGQDLAGRRNPSAAQLSPIQGHPRAAGPIGTAKDGSPPPKARSWD